MNKETVLVIGANGQIGSVLTRALQTKYGEDAVIATDIHAPQEVVGKFELLDVLDAARLDQLVRRYRVTQIYHLAAILSAKGESMPRQAWDINMNSLFNVLEVCKEHRIRLFFPSSIAVFGANTPRRLTPQDTVTQPNTVYGISKVAGENWCQYYFQKYGVDVRSVRYPGIVGHESMPGGGTTDYAVEIYHKAVQGLPFSCFLAAHTRLPMMYMPDAVRAALEIMEAPARAINIRTSYNLAAMSFTPSEITKEIRRIYPDFAVRYEPDFRQQIASSWSETIDDSVARQDWNWRPEYNLSSMTQDMILHLKERYRLIV